MKKLWKKAKPVGDISGSRLSKVSVFTLYAVL